MLSPETNNPSTDPIDLLAHVRRIFNPIFSLTGPEAEQMQCLEQRSSAWLEARVNRITASNFGSAIGVNPYCSPDDLLVQLLFKSFTGNEATAYGTAKEPIACDAYVKTLASDLIYSSGLPGEADLPPPTWRESGLSISPRFPFLGASPDGIITTHAKSSLVPINLRCHSAPEYNLTSNQFDALRGIVSVPLWEHPTQYPHEFLLEIKCPYRKRLYGPIPPYYYAQIQGCMEILDLPYCHFYVWTPTKAGIDCYPRNAKYWNELMMPRLCDFYFQKFVPAVVMLSLDLLDTSDRFGPNPAWLLPKSSVSAQFIDEIHKTCANYRSLVGF